MVLLLSTALMRSLWSAEPVKQSLLTSWGSDHVGREISDFLTGDQCLFCHRDDVGPGWSQNRHGQTVRLAQPDSEAHRALTNLESFAEIARETTYIMGHDRQQRFLKPGSEFGQLELLSTRWTPATEKEPGRLGHTANPDWDAHLFADSCAGCHATAVDATTRRFEAVSLDCFVCHGVVSEDHTEQPSLARFSHDWNGSAREEISVCSQCHLRGGRSRTSGLPYPNNFVAGDNLFLDYKVDLSETAIARENPLDGHVRETVRNVLLSREEHVTCLTCHSVHEQSTARHQLLDQTELCWQCHVDNGPTLKLKRYEARSTTCGY